MSRIIFGLRWEEYNPFEEYNRSEERVLEQAYRDSQGVIRWKINHLPVPEYFHKIARRWPEEKVITETPNLIGQRRRAQRDNR